MYYITIDICIVTHLIIGIEHWNPTFPWLYKYGHVEVEEVAEVVVHVDGGVKLHYVHRLAHVNVALGIVRGKSLLRFPEEEN